MNPAAQKWISRKEIAYLVDRTYRVVAANEARWGLAEFRIRVNARCVLFRRLPTLEKLACLKLL